MQGFLTAFFIGLFISLLFTNFYFKSKLIKKFRILTQNDVRFQWGHLISEKKMKEEIIPHYPNLEVEILAFQKLIKKAMIIMLSLLIVITLAAYIVLKSKV